MKLLFASLMLSLAIIATIALSTPVSAAGVNNNPWGYNYTAAQGSLIYVPPSGFCGYFRCIPNFKNGVGYVIECHDGWFSKSGGRRGSCSYHGGPGQTLYAHVSRRVSSNPVHSASSQPVTSGSDPY